MFVSCFVDGTLWIWGTRHREQSTIFIHQGPDADVNADVNVISWNTWIDFHCISFLFILDVYVFCG